MSTALLQELHQEYRRLYIAGSELAAGDFRLKRLLPQFQQLGERSPVFKKLGEGITALIEAGSPDSLAPGIQLQENTLLLESVLYTQGTTSVEGTPGPLPVRKFTLQTNQTYRKLAPVIEALTTTGSGRYEIVLDAYKEGVFQDLRLLPLAVSALNDPYSELAEYAKNHILPSYGPEIAGYLLESFNPAGGGARSASWRSLPKQALPVTSMLLFKQPRTAAMRSGQRPSSVWESMRNIQDCCWSGLPTRRKSSVKLPTQRWQRVDRHRERRGLLRCSSRRRTVRC